MGQAAHWRDRSYEPGVPPCGIVWLPDGVGQWQGGVGGFFVCVGSLFRSLVYEYVHFLFHIIERLAGTCAEHPSTSSLRVLGVV